jgi:hypothetical protein
MKLSYAITVCNESKDLYALISFLKSVKDTDDEINVLLDTLHTNETTINILEHFKDDIVVNKRDFCGNFSDHRNFHLKKCIGDYIFVVDADEMPKEKLIVGLKGAIEESGADMIRIPRINIHPGCTREWLKKYKFNTNEMDWINWPDYQGRVFKNDPENIYYGNKLHENIIGVKNPVSLEPDPTLALWHIKSVHKQDNRWNTDGTYKSPDGKNLYDSLL